MIVPPARIVLIGVAVGLSCPLVLLAYKDGPMPNMAGGFGDATCQQCHLDQPLNAPGGTLALTGVPDRFEAGHVYPLTVRLARANLRRGGFELGARYADGDRRALQAGTWRTVDARVQIRPSQNGTLVFAQHTSAGSLGATRGALEWTVEWTAPSDVAAPVQFNLAANASNDDESPLGDHIYTLEQQCPPMAGHAHNAERGMQIAELSRNSESGMRK